MNTWLIDRRHKDITRELASDFSTRRSALFLPADQAKCILQAEKSGMIARGKTKLVIVERNKRVLLEMEKTLEKERWLQHARVHFGDLANLSIPFALDYAWIDLNGTINAKLAAWIATELSDNLLPGAVVCLTHEYCWRNNLWLKETRKTINQTEGLSYTNFRLNKSILQDKYTAFPAYLMHCLLRDWQLEILEPYRYFDTIDMVFYRFIVVKRQNTFFPCVINQSLVNKVRVPNKKESIVATKKKVSNAADKAWATRRAQAAAEKRSARRSAAAKKAWKTRKSD